MKGLPEGASAKQRNRRAEFAVYALRVELLRQMLGAQSFEAFSVTLASSDLLTDFCGCRSIAWYPLDIEEFSAPRFNFV